jgi:tetratricopeptide (TPR) repeat protein
MYKGLMVIIILMLSVLKGSGQDAEYYHYFNAADSLLRAGDTLRAERFLHDCLSLDPRKTGAYNLLGHVRLKQGRYDEALAMLDSSIALDPSDVRSVHLRVIVLRSSGRPADALEAANNLIRSLPEAELYLERGHIHLALKDRRSACFDFKTAYLKGTDDAKTLIGKHCKGKL